MVESSQAVAKPDAARFEHGTIQFEIKDEDQGIFAGKSVTGAILVNMTQQFEAKSIHLCLYGCEESNFTLTNEAGVKSKFVAKYEIIKLSFHVKDTVDEVQPAGQYWYPFELMIPAWLPTSTIFTAEKDNTQF